MVERKIFNPDGSISRPTEEEALASIPEAWWEREWQTAEEIMLGRKPWPHPHEVGIKGKERPFPHERTNPLDTG